MSHYGDVFYSVSDGLTLYARDYPGPLADSPVVLCLHGLTRNAIDFDVIAPQLAKTHRVLVADQRGRGRSDYDPDPMRYQLPNYVGDMLALLSHLDVSSVAVLGTSMGGLMAMALASVAPTMLGAVILNDIGPEVAQRGLDRINGYVGKNTHFATWDDAVAYNRSINGAAFPGLSDQQWDQFTRQLFAERDGLPTLAYDPAISQPVRANPTAAVPPDLWPLFDAMAGIPLMVIRGELSDILERECVQSMQQRRPDLVYLEVPGVGHAPLLHQPQECDAVIAFLASGINLGGLHP